MANKTLPAEAFESWSRVLKFFPVSGAPAQLVGQLWPRGAGRQ